MTRVKHGKLNLVLRNVKLWNHAKVPRDQAGIIKWAMVKSLEYKKKNIWMLIPECLAPYYKRDSHKKIFE